MNQELIIIPLIIGMLGIFAITLILFAFKTINFNQLIPLMVITEMLFIEAYLITSLLIMEMRK